MKIDVKVGGGTKAISGTFESYGQSRIIIPTKKPPSSISVGISFSEQFGGSGVGYAMLILSDNGYNCKYSEGGYWGSSGSYEHGYATITASANINTDGTVTLDVSAGYEYKRITIGTVHGTFA